MRTNKRQRSRFGLPLSAPTFPWVVGIAIFGPHCGEGIDTSALNTPKGGPSCTAITCVAAGKNCGEISDGCGGTLNCGTCSGSETCGGAGTPNVCGEVACTRTSCGAEAKNCGNISDGCGGTLNCGTCSGSETCGGGGTTNVCGEEACTPTTCAAEGKNCGTISDGCDGTISCGACNDGKTCGGGGEENVCGGTACTPSAWASTTVDLDGWQSDLALDSLGNAHMSFHDYSDGTLRYAYRGSLGNWSLSTVDAPGVVSGGTSIAVDHSGGVHISYYDTSSDPTDGDLRYAYRSPEGTWSAGMVDVTGDVGTQSDLALDKSGGVHICYLGHTNNHLKYAYRAAGGAWSTSIVSENAYYPSLAVDAADGIHISYVDDVAGEFKYAYRESEAEVWSISLVDSVGSFGGESSLALDHLGGVHVCYDDGTGLKYANLLSGGAWSISTVAEGGDPSLAVDGGGAVHLTYLSYTSAAVLNYGYMVPGEPWLITTVDSDGGAWGETSLALDSLGGVHVGYYFSPNFDLKYGYMCP